MELHSNLYYTHPNTEIMQKLGRLFQEHCGEQDKFIAIAVELNSQLGQELAEDLLNTVDNIDFDLGPESLHAIAGYSVAHFVHGSSGDEFIEAILLFLKALLPEIHTLAWGCGDDEPFNDPEQDDEIKSSIYTWWHTGLPEKIKEGFLNQA